MQHSVTGMTTPVYRLTVFCHATESARTTWPVWIQFVVWRIRASFLIWLRLVVHVTVYITVWLPPTCWVSCGHVSDDDVAPP